MLRGDRATPFLIGSKGHETVKKIYADANARITQNGGFEDQTIVRERRNSLLYS